MLIARHIDRTPELLELSLSMAYRVVATRPEHKAITESIVAIKRQWKERDGEEAMVKFLQGQGMQVKRQVSCPAGKLDLVTPDALYEVELFLSRDIFFHALGQILLYRQSFDPTRNAIIAGLADPGSDVTDLINYADQLGVKVQFWTVSTTPRTARGTHAKDMLQNVTSQLNALSPIARNVPDDAQTLRDLDHAAQALGAIRHMVQRKHGHP
jgi:hypothetical protein